MRTQVADDEITTPHGGQDWRSCSTFVEDFSVTTNGLGAPKIALREAAAALTQIGHYPPANFEPHLSDLADFLWGKASVEHRDCLQLGNGASELIDLVIRACAISNGAPGAWRPGPYAVQYEEYKRSAEAAGFSRSSAEDSDARLLCMVNPSNPTGDYLSVNKIMRYIEENCTGGSTVIVDESMQPWRSPNWREDSLVSQHRWLHAMSCERGVDVFVIHSWTKLWSCPGIRLGSVVTPTAAHMKRMMAKQVPWSVNIVALEFLSGAVRDHSFMQETWSVTPVWRASMVEMIKTNFPDWDCFGESFLSWVWIDTHDETVAARSVDSAKRAGCPIRWGKPGYGMPTFLRFAVRHHTVFSSLMRALMSEFSVKPARL